MLDVDIVEFSCEDASERLDCDKGFRGTLQMVEVLALYHEILRL